MTDKRLAPGDPAPDFTLPDADGQPVALSSFRGQRVIVYFYPAAMTPGCTKEACDFRDNLSDLNGQGIAVLGISPDKPAKLAKFRDKEGLTFPLLSDPDHADGPLAVQHLLPVGAVGLEHAVIGVGQQREGQALFVAELD